MPSRPVLLAFIALLLCITARLAGETITLKDGTVIEGKVITQGDKYWIKSANGATRTVAISDVKSITGGPPDPASRPGGAPAFLMARAKADSVEFPLAAVGIWLKYIEVNPASPDLPKAQAELDTWKVQADHGLQRISNKFQNAEQRKALGTRLAKMNEEAVAFLKDKKPLQAVKRLDEAWRFYPQSYALTYQFGYVCLMTGKQDEALVCYEHCVKLRPDSPEALNNLGLLLWSKDYQERAMLMLQRAAESNDSEAIAKNMAKASALLAADLRKNPKVKPSLDAADALIAKYKLAGSADWKTAQWQMITNRPEDIEDPAGATGVLAAANGFVIREDGLILTNRHVTEYGPVYLVRVGSDDLRPADLVASDPERNLALLRIKPAGKLPALSLAKADSADGEECFTCAYHSAERNATPNTIDGAMAKGYPALGIDFIIDAKFPAAATGGPVLNKTGQVIGMLTMKGRRPGDEATGASIGLARIRAFLDKQKITLASAPAGDPLTHDSAAARIGPSLVVVVSSR